MSIARRANSKASGALVKLESLTYGRSPTFDATVRARRRIARNRGAGILPGFIASDRKQTIIADDKRTFCLIGKHLQDAKDRDFAASA